MTSLIVIIIIMSWVNILLTTLSFYDFACELENVTMNMKVLVGWSPPNNWNEIQMPINSTIIIYELGQHITIYFL